MKKTAKTMLRNIATRGVIAAIPVALVGGYATNMAVPTPPRIAEYAIQQVAEITVSPDTVGIAASPLYGQSQADINAQLDQLQALGVKNIRVFVPWALVQPAANTYNWSLLDRVMTAAAARNMGVLAEVNSTPVWATKSGQVTYNGASTPSPTKMADFMKVFVAKYGSTVSGYEIWNEPNAVTFSNPIDPAAYADLLKAVYPVIKAADPTATVVAGAVGHVYTVGGLTMDPVDFVKAMLNAGAGNYFDALSYHPYDETMPFSAGNVNPNSSFFASDTAYNQVKDLMGLIPTKKVWISEFGVPTYGSVTQAKQEALITNLLQNWDKLGQAGPVFLYTGRDTATGSTDPNANYGLYTDAGLPKAVVAYLQAYYRAHPQNPATTQPTTPVTPTTPVIPTVPATPPRANTPAAALAAFVQALAQQLNQLIAQMFTPKVAAVKTASAVIEVTKVADSTDTSTTPATAPVTAPPKTAKPAVTESTRSTSAEAATSSTSTSTSTTVGSSTDSPAKSGSADVDKGGKDAAAAPSKSKTGSKKAGADAGAKSAGAASSKSSGSHRGRSQG